MPSFKCMREYSVLADGLDFTRRAEARKQVHKEAASRLLQALVITPNKLHTVRITETFEEKEIVGGVIGHFIMEVFIGGTHE